VKVKDNAPLRIADLKTNGTVQAVDRKRWLTGRMVDQEREGGRTNRPHFSQPNNRRIV
jgi:hypothetical protein